jgi:Amt family ammonium transporter
MGVTDYLAVDTSTKVAEYAFGTQMTAQFWSVIVAVVLSAVVSVIALTICKFTVGLRVDEQSEREGLDLSSHGERAYS